MSRCFPFPPPGYVVNGGHDEAMIESSSIKGEEEKSKKEHKRKERKRDKKEKKDKKDKKRERGEGESEKHSHKRRRKEGEEVVKDVQKNHRVDVFGKLKQSENSCLEKSSLTVERELVQSTSQNSCDSTLNSNEKEKQKVTLNGRHHNNNESTPNSNELRMEKEKQPIDGRHNNHSTELCKEKEKQLMDCRHNNNNNNNNNDSESIIRIRLPIRRPPKDPEVTNKDHQPCPSREIKLEQPKQHPCSTSEHASKPHEEEKRKKEHSSKSKHKEKKLSFATREALQFLNVVENWVPNRVELTNSEDEEPWWLMKKPSSHKIDLQQVNRNNETKEQVMSTTWPRARLLPDADVYALPYTVPF